MFFFLMCHLLLFFRISCVSSFFLLKANWPKKKRTFCRKCGDHQEHGVTWLKKAGKASTVAQGKRRYDRKQAGFGGQTKPILKKKVCIASVLHCKLH